MSIQMHPAAYDQRQPTHAEILADAFSKAFIPSFTGTLQNKLEEHHDQQRQRQQFDEMGSLLNQVPENANPVQIAQLGQRLGVSPQAVEGAIGLHQQTQAQNMLQQRQQQAILKQQADYNKVLNDNPALKASAKSYENIMQSGNKANETLSNVGKLRNLIAQGAGEDFSSKAASVLGKHTTLGKIYMRNESEPSAAFNAVSKHFLSSFKQTFGARITDADLSFIESAIPSLSRSPKQNLAILDTYEQMAKKYIKESEIASNIVHQNSGIAPPDLDEQIAFYMKPFNEQLEKQKQNAITGEVPQDKATVEFNGKQYSIPKENLEKAIQKGAKLI